MFLTSALDVVHPDLLVIRCISLVYGESSAHSHGPAGHLRVLPVEVIVAHRAPHSSMSHLQSALSLSLTLSIRYFFACQALPPMLALATRPCLAHPIPRTLVDAPPIARNVQVRTHDVFASLEDLLLSLFMSLARHFS